MSTHTFALDNMKTDECEQFLCELADAPEASHYQFDFANLGHVSPFGMLICSQAIAQFKKAHLGARLEALNFAKHTYPGHMGFFKAFGLDFGREPGEASGNDRYIPVTIISVDQIRKDASDNFMLVQSWLEREARRLTTMLLQDTPLEIKRTLVFALTEVLRNIVEHSQSPRLGYCAQYWPSSNTVEVGIIDSGVGVAASLGRNPFWKIQNESHALHLALLPGVSGTAFEGAPRDKDDVWANAGFGLYMTSAICREAGNFLIASGSASVELVAGKKINRRMPIGGTAVRLRVTLSRLEGIDSRRRELLEYGDRLASRLRGTLPNPAAASRMVRGSSEYDPNS